MKHDVRTPERINTFKQMGLAVMVQDVGCLKGNREWQIQQFLGVTKESYSKTSLKVYGETIAMESVGIITGQDMRLY